MRHAFYNRSDSATAGLCPPPPPLGFAARLTGPKPSASLDHWPGTTLISRTRRLVPPWTAARGRARGGVLVFRPQTSCHRVRWDTSCSGPCRSRRSGGRGVWQRGQAGAQDRVDRFGGWESVPVGPGRESPSSAPGITMGTLHLFYKQCLSRHSICSEWIALACFIRGQPKCYMPHPLESNNVMPNKPRVSGPA